MEKKPLNPHGSLNFLMRKKPLNPHGSLNFSWKKNLEHSLVVLLTFNIRNPLNPSWFFEIFNVKNA
jgi:hypothetical protein